MTERIYQSRFWPALWEEYSAVPSVALCRVPELEYASTLDVDCDILDHGCGDGLFAALAWPNKTITAGCDLDERAVEGARKRGHYGSVDVCDASKNLPFPDASFDLVFDNSALEHMPDLEPALAHVSRVLRPGGVFAFNVLNHRYFEWWPLSDAARDRYRRIQPFFHALSLSEWSDRLSQVGLRVVTACGYLDRQAARRLARLDYHFSNAYLAKRQSALVAVYRWGRSLTKSYWRRRLAALTWKTHSDTGAGYFIKAVRSDG